MLCNKCQLNKNVDDFAYKNLSLGTRKKICRACHSEYRRKHYLLNKQKYIVKAISWNTKQKQILSQYIYEILSKSQCIDCKEKDIVVLDFDHLNNKTLGIAEMYKNCYSLQKIKDEIEKCVIRCANCHRRKTAKERGTWKFRKIESSINKGV